MVHTHARREQTKLNQVERWKAARHPLEVKQAVLDRYALEGPASILSVEGETERLKWVGLYPQRQGGDAFMLRVKIPGGRLTAAQARLIGEIADEHARGPEPHPSVGRRLSRPDHAAGHPAALDQDRRGAGDLAPAGGGRYHDRPGLRRLGAQRALLPGLRHRRRGGHRRLPDRGGHQRFLHRQSRVRQSAPQVQDERHRLPRGLRPGGDQRCGLRPRAARRRARPGSTCWSAAGSPTGHDWPPTSTSSSTRAMRSRSAARWRSSSTSSATATTAGPAACAIWCRSWGRRRSGPSWRRERAVPLTPAGEHLTNRYRGDHIGVHPQRQEGLSYVGVNVTVGRMTGTNLVEMARLAETYGDGEIRLTTDQNLILTGVPEESLAALLAEPLLQTHSPNPKPFERGAVACTGNEFCRLAIVETKARALQWAQELDRRVTIDGRGHRPPPLLRLLGLLRSAADRRRRLPGGDGQDRRRHRRGSRHRAGRQSGPRRRLHRLGRGRQAGDRGAGRHGPPLRPLRRGAARGRAVFYQWARRMPNDGLRTPSPFGCPARAGSSQ